MPLLKREYDVTITNTQDKKYVFRVVATSEPKAIIEALKKLKKAMILQPITITVTPLGRAPHAA